MKEVFNIKQFAARRVREIVDLLEACVTRTSPNLYPMVEDIVRTRNGVKYKIKKITVSAVQYKV